jgi:hypothetical protein
MKVSTQTNVTTLSPDHPDPATGNTLLMEALGTADMDFANGLLQQLAKLALERNMRGSIEFVMNKIALDPLGMMMWYFVEKPIYLFQWTNIDGVGDVFVYPIFTSPFRENACS